MGRPDRAFDRPYIRSRVLGVETIAISDPEGVRHVLTANAGNYRRPYSVTRISRPLGGSGLFLAEGADWRRQRRVLAPTFTPATIGLLLPHFRDAGLHLLRSIEMSSRANLSKAFQDAALEAVLRALFSLPESGNREQLRDMVRDFIEGPGRPTLMDGFARSEDTFSFANAKRGRFQRYWRAAIDQIVSRRKTSLTAPAHRDLLDLLLSVRDTETGEALSDGEIRDQRATMFFAGSETTVRLLFWACYLLAMDSEEQTRVREEVTAFRPKRIDGPDHLQNWRRLRNVLLEALRLYPPVPQIIRVANGPDVICGEKIVANTHVLDQFMGDASPSEILGSADCLPARSVCGKNGPMDANAGLYSIRRGTPHLHRPLVCIVGGRDGHGAAAVVLRDQSAGCAARVANRPHNNRAVLRTLI